jgi:hypothetical protein
MQRNDAIVGHLGMRRVEPAVGVALQLRRSPRQVNQQAIENVTRKGASGRLFREQLAASRFNQSVNRVMVTHVHRDDLLVLNQQLQRDAV